MKGNNSQIEWAEKIKAGVLLSIESNNKKIIQVINESGSNLPKVKRLQNDLKDNNAAADFFSTCDDASQIIINRDFSPANGVQRGARIITPQNYPI